MIAVTVSPGIQVVREREPFADDDLVGPRAVDVTAALDDDVVQHRTTLGWNRDEPPGRRLAQPLDVERDVHHHACLDLRHPGYVGDAVAQSPWRALERGEHIGEPLALVVARLGQPQRVEAAVVHDQHHHADGDDEADGDRLALDVP